MKKTIYAIMAVAALISSCHKQDTPAPVFPKENIVWKNTQDTVVQLTFIHDTLTLSRGGTPVLISIYADLGHDTIELGGMAKTKAIVKATRDSLSYTNVSSGEMLQFFK